MTCRSEGEPRACCSVRGPFTATFGLRWSVEVTKELADYDVNPAPVSKMRSAVAPDTKARHMTIGASPKLLRGGFLEGFCVKICLKRRFRGVALTSQSIGSPSIF